MADGSINIDAKLNTSGFKKGLSGLGSLASGAVGAISKGLSGLGSLASGAVGAISKGLSGLGSTASGAVGAISKELSGLGSTASGAVEAISNCILAGSAAMSAATVALVKTSVQSYAQYEQLVGGVETLFGAGGKSLEEYANSVGKTVGEVESEYNRLMQSQEMVLSNAADAYANAGLSANEYMETVTSFSASLLQGLGGDTEQAAQIADLAITDMADNANKMGTSMESIQNAYQGFAKQNYTMLDNLKLGYGGTQSEMIRLINDSGILEEKITSMDDITFDQMIQAIHEVQTNLGITGTTALEASSTIEGSMNAAKAAWSNLLTGIADENADFEQLVDNFVDSVAVAGENILPRVEIAINGVGQLIEQLLPVVMESVPKIIMDELPGILTAGTNIVITLLEGIVSGIPGLIPVVTQLILMLVNSLISLFPQLIDAGLQIVIQLALGIAEALPEMIPAIVDAIVLIVETLIDNIDMLVDAAIAIVVALTEGLINAYPRLAEKIPVIIEKLLNTLLTNIPKLAKAAMEILQVLAKGIIQNTPVLLAQIPELIDMFSNAMIDSLGVIVKVGYYIVKGIWDGISSNVTWLLSKVGGFAKSIIDKAKSALGIHSPSKEFAWIGKMCLEGFDQEFEDFNPYDTLSRSIKANKTTLSMNYNAGIEAEYGPFGNDYGRFGDAVVDAFVKAGITVDVDRRPFGRLVRGYA